MKTTGIIAEFNPFHNGHAYLLQKARELTGAELVIVVMSGDFVQRGAPALLSKYARAEMALRCGADLVIELPVFSACASAEYFAEGALRILTDLGADSFCFGSESGDLNALDALAGILTAEPEEYRALLKKHLASGMSFPASRRAAVTAILPESSSLLDTPNNLLAVEYLKACRRRHFAIRPYTIVRAGSSYHDTALSAGVFPSASALRSFLSDEVMPLSLISLSESMPMPAYEILEREFFRTFPVTENDFSNLLSYQLLHTTLPELADIADIGPELANRIFARRFDCIRTREFTQSLKTKELTYTRLSRALLHSILRITAKEQESFRQLPHSPYLRVLGLTAAARPFLKELQNNTELPLLMKPAKARRLLSGEAFSLFEKDITASELYRQISFDRYQVAQPSEFTHEILVLE